MNDGGVRRGTSERSMYEIIYRYRLMKVENERLPMLGVQKIAEVCGESETAYANKHDEKREKRPMDTHIQKSIRCQNERIDHNSSCELARAACRSVCEPCLRQCARLEVRVGT